jgi:hypothetical protein
MAETNTYQMAEADRPLTDPEDVNTPARGDDTVARADDDDEFDDEDDEDDEAETDEE